MEIRPVVFDPASKTMRSFTSGIDFRQPLHVLCISMNIIIFITVIIPCNYYKYNNIHNTVWVMDTKNIAKFN